MNISIKDCSSEDQSDWVSLRAALWPDTSLAEHLEEMRDLLARPEKYVQFIAYSELKTPLGFVEASLRHDYVNGTNSSPVAFLEGIYVVPDFRNIGIAARFFSVVEDWACSIGCSELASDAALGNLTSHQVHHAMGFKETERVVYFSKNLTRRSNRKVT